MSKAIYRSPIHPPIYFATVRTNDDGKFVVAAEHAFVGNTSQGEPFDDSADAIKYADEVAADLRRATGKVAQLLAAKRVNVSGMGPEEIIEACERGDISI